MTIQIEAGKFYQRRDGIVVGPAKPSMGEQVNVHPWMLGPYGYTGTGRYIAEGLSCNLDLVAEVSPSGEAIDERKPVPLVAGHYYRMRNGLVIGPARLRDSAFSKGPYRWQVDGKGYTSAGGYWAPEDGGFIWSAFDLVEDLGTDAPAVEAVDEPLPLPSSAQEMLNAAFVADDIARDTQADLKFTTVKRGLHEHVIKVERVEPSAKTASPITKRGVLEKAIEAVADRGLNYGRPEDNFERIAALWRTHLHNRYGAVSAGTIDAQDVAMMMVLMKVARLENSPGHMDSWIDIAGYAACGGEIAGR